ncbi:MAG: filamentous hemagglutinin N-terminal domain-containing protein [Oscillatoriales cyanobacterium C42_A2020_001]|nr:filamentous hemagglutinin N-terminal domain-containing protein [Leptolyngbyaceae cyanobacterium C42_A2020_001]
MTRSRIRQLWRSPLAASFAIATTLLLPQSALAQNISFDGTLGRPDTLIGPNYTIDPSLGQTRGSNLFHSFRQFNLSTGEIATFQSGANIQNILARVTGGTSSIDGLIKTQGSNANLFLINPRGIVFGANARLDVAGSFVATTADSLKFPDGSEFSATNPQPAPLLAMNITPGLQYGTRQGPISNAGQLTVAAGHNLTLLGTTVTHTGTLMAPGGRVEVLGDRVALLGRSSIDVSAAGGGGTVLIGGDFQGKGSVPNAAQTVVAPTASIKADAIATGNGGTVIIWSDKSTRFYGSISARGGNEGGNGGFIEVSGKEALDYNGVVDAGATRGTPGTFLLDPTNIEIVASGGDTSNLETVDEFGDPNLNSNVTRLNVAAINNATADVVLQATNNITFSAPVDIERQGVKLTADAGNNLFVNANILTNSGNITLRAENGVFVSGAIIDSNKTDSPVESFVAIGGRQLVSISNDSLIRSRVNNTSTTKSDTGAIAIVSREGSVLLNNSEISTTNLGGGVAGDVLITAKDTVSLRNGTKIFSSGNQGRVFIGQSNFSDLTPVAIELSGSSLQTDNQPPNPNIPADLRIDAGGVSLIAERSVSLTNGSRISSSTSRLGNPGIVLLGTEGGDVSLSGGSRIFTQIVPGGIASLTSSSEFAGGAFNALLGRSDTEVVGSTFVLTGSLSITDNSFISATTFGTGNAGAVVVLATDEVVLSNGGAIFSRSAIDPDTGIPAKGDAGGIVIGTGSLAIRGTDSGLTTATTGTGDAGAILVFADNRISIDGQGSGIFSSVFSETAQKGGAIGLSARSLVLKNGGTISVNNESSGSAGEIFIASLATFLDQNSQISATTRSGEGGNIELNVAVLNLYRTSSISTDADTARLTSGIQPGGNIRIEGIPQLGFDRTIVIAAKPGRDSNIVAKAFRGRGGDISIFAGRLLDIRQRPEVSATNDIDASSQFGADGSVTVSTLDIDPERGTIQLAGDLVDASQLIAEGCDTRGKLALGRLTNAGRGGLPPSPVDALADDEVAADWVSVDPILAEQPHAGEARNTIDPRSVDFSKNLKKIIEAQDWIVDTDGNVVLVTQAAEVLPQVPWLAPSACRVP